MKYSYKYPVSQYTRPSTYSPANYTSTSYTTKSYSTSTYSPSSYHSTKFTPTHYAPTLFSPPAYTPAYRSTSSYSYASAYSKPARQVSNQVKPAQQIPTATVKPAKAVRFTNDIIFQDYIRHGELELIGRFMRARKVRVNTVFPSGMAALHEAVLSGNLECVKLLVKYGADVHQRDEDDWTPLHMACSDGYPEIAQYLLSLGASTEAENTNGEKPADLIDPDCKELAKLFKVGCV